MAFRSTRSLIENLLPPPAARGLLAAIDAFAPFLASGGGTSTRRMAASAFLVRVLSAALAYVSQMLLARWMGGFEYGVFVVLWTLVITLGVVFAFGLEQSVITLLRKYAHEGDHAAARGLLVASRLFAFALASLIAGAGCAVLWLRPDLVTGYYAVPVFVAAVCLPIYTVAEIQDGIAVAHGWPDLALMPTFLARPALILLLVGGAFFADLPTTAVTACWAAVAAAWSVTLAQTLLLRRRLATILPRVAPRWDVRLWVGLSAPMFLVDAFLVLLNSVDILMVGRFAEPDRVAIYFATVKTLALVHFVHYAARVASAERFATAWHAGDRAGLVTFVARVVKWTFWASLAMSIALLIVGRPLLWLFGPDFTEGYPILFVLIVGALARASVGPAETLLTMAGQQSASALVYGMTFAVSLLLNAILIPIYGIWGAAWATMAAMVFESVVLASVVRRRLGLDVFVGTSTEKASAKA